MSYYSDLKGLSEITADEVIIDGSLDISAAQITGSIIPDQNDVYNIGSVTNTYANIYATNVFNSPNLEVDFISSFTNNPTGTINVNSPVNFNEQISLTQPFNQITFHPNGVGPFCLFRCDGVTANSIVDLPPNISGNVVLDSNNNVFSGTNTFNNNVTATSLNTDVISSNSTSYVEFQNDTRLLSLAENAVLGTDNNHQIMATQLTNGELLIGSTSNNPVAATLTGTTDQINITNGAGAITLSTPQNIDTAANVTFNTVNATTSMTSLIYNGSIQSFNSGSNLTLLSQNSNPSTGFLFMLSNAGYYCMGGNTSLASALTVRGKSSNYLAFRDFAIGPDTYNFANLSGLAIYEAQTILRFLINVTTGNVSIGNSNNTYNLDVTGSIRGSSLVLGTSSNIPTITPGTFAAARSYNLPDAGANANMVLDQGNYTFAGNYIFSGQNTYTNTNQFRGGAFFFITDATDQTKQILFNMAGNTTGKTLTLATNQTTTATINVPNSITNESLATRGNNLFKASNSNFTTTSTVTAAQMLNRIIQLSGSTTGQTINWDTATNIISAIGNTAANDAFEVLIINQASTTFTLGTGTSITTQYTGTTVAPNTSRRLWFVVTNIVIPSVEVWG